MHRKLTTGWSKITFRLQMLTVKDGGDVKNCTMTYFDGNFDGKFIILIKYTNKTKN